MVANVAETELANVQSDLSAAHAQAQYMDQQWADIHADMLEERDRCQVGQLWGLLLFFHAVTLNLKAQHGSLEIHYLLCSVTSAQRLGKVCDCTLA